MPANLLPLFPNGLAGVALMLATPAAFIALNGFDTVAAAGNEVVKPERTLPRAILLTLVIAVSLYMLVILAALGSLPWQVLGASTVPLADAAQSSLGPLGARLVALAAVVTTATSANATLIVGSRVLFTFARHREDVARSHAAAPDCARSSTNESTLRRRIADRRGYDCDGAWRNSCGRGGGLRLSVHPPLRVSTCQSGTGAKTLRTNSHLPISNASRASTSGRSRLRSPALCQRAHRYRRRRRLAADRCHGASGASARRDSIVSGAGVARPLG